MKRFALCIFACIALLLVTSSSSVSQVSTGNYPLGSYTSGPDVTNLGNLNVNFRIPVLVKPGRGIPFTYELSVDTSIWIPTLVSGSRTWQPVGGWGWKDVTEVITGYVSFSSTLQSVLCGAKPNLMHGTDRTTSNWVYHDRLGGLHPFTGTTDVLTGQCGTSSTSFTNLAADGSGYTLIANGTSATLISPDGGVANPPVNQKIGAATTHDVNGNQVTISNANTFTDTLGTTVLTTSGTAPNPLVYTYTDSSNVSRSITVNYATVTVKTNYGCPGIAEYGPTSASIISSITYPDGSSYSFTYEPTPGFAGDTTGRLQSITLRTGGTISYSYSGGNNGIICSDGSTASFTRTTSDGNTAYSRTGSGTAWTTTVTDAQNNVTAINFQTSVPPGGTIPNFYETRRTVNQGVATSLLTKDTCYNNATPNCSSTAITLPFTTVASYVTLNNGQQSEVFTALNSFGLPTSIVEYDFGTGAPGQPLRRTVISYNTSLGNIVDHPSSISVLDGPGTTTVARTTFNYDETAVVATSGVPQHVAVSTPRGNLTSLNQWVNTSNTFLTTHFTYDDTGNILTRTDPGGHQVQFSYTDNFSDGINRNSDAYVTQVTQPDTHSPNLAHHTLRSQYDANTGLRVSAWDQNGNQTRMTYDAMLRPQQINFPDGGQTTILYDSVNQTHTETKIDATRTAFSYVLVDGYGRTSRTARANGETVPYDQQDVCYDSNGLIGFTSYPYQGQGFSDPKRCSGAGDSSTYDGGARLTQLMHSDGSTIQYSYTGRATQVTDEGNGSFRVMRVLQADALGRLANVCEVTSGVLLGDGGTPASCGLDIAATGFLTSYGYNTLGNTISVSQGSLSPRTFSYDSLSRLISESEPEWGTGSSTTYTYNSDSLVSQRTRPAPNQTNPAVTVNTTYGYDELHRLRTVTYSDGTTPLRTLNYDETTQWGVALLNTTGRLSSESAGGTSGSIFSYDSMGRTVNNWQCTPINCGTGSFALSYGYDLFGNMTTSSNGAGVTFNYSYNTAPRLTGATSSFSDAQHPANLLSNVHYGQFGPLTDMLGNGLSETFGYNNYGAWQSYSSTPYAFSLNFAPDWSVTSANDSINGNWTYTYDQFNRLAGSSQSSPLQTFGYAYDRNGNRLQQNAPQGGPAPQYVFDSTTNHISGSSVTYDALGNVTQDGPTSNGFHTYTYDAENRVIQVDGGATATYSYDAEGRRIHTPSYESVYDLTGNAITLFSLSGVWSYGEIYVGGRHLATYSGATTNFLHTDWLATKRLMTDITGVPSQTCTSLPFGDGATCTGTNWNFNLFTDTVHDSESNLEHTWFRQYSGTEGRFMTTDPFQGSMDLANPQSLNRYGYVNDDPLNFADRLGLSTGVEFIGGCLVKQVFGFASGADEAAGRETLIRSEVLFCTDGGGGGGVDPGGVGGGGGTGKKSPCNSIPSNGATFPVRINSQSDFRLQFDGNGQLIGIGIQLTGNQGGTIQNISIPANTYVGITLNNPSTVSFGFSNPVKFSQGVASVKQAYFQTATFSNGQFTNVRGAWAPFGIPIGSTTGNSSILQSALNGQQSAKDLASKLLNAANVVSKWVTCTNIFGAN